MTAGSSIDPAEFLHEHLAQASPDLLRELMQGFINTLLSADADSVCGAAYGARDEARTNSRNGYRHRDLDTRLGTLDVAVPQLRHDTYFPDWPHGYSGAARRRSFSHGVDIRRLMPR